MSERERRLEALSGLGCILCRQRHRFQHGDIHHLNLGGHAGQKRRGDRFTICLCPWHHRAVPLPGLDLKRTETLCGPSLARSPRLFRETWGSDDDLLYHQDELLVQHGYTFPPKGPFARSVAD